jgi:methionyl-tRNA formyltransferase
LNALPWRVVFFGTPQFAVATLEALLGGSDRVVAAVTQPDRERGRGRKVAASPVKELASRVLVPVLQPERLKEESFQAQIQALHPDLFVVIAYGRILPRSLLDIPEHGAVNVHASLLPCYRGAAPIAWAILKGERITGVTTMLMDEGLDTGAVLLQEELRIHEGETAGSLADRLSPVGARLLMQTVEGIKRGDLVPAPQDEVRATYAPPLKKEDGRIDWREGAAVIDAHVRAFNPWPGSFTEWEGKIVKIFRGETREGTAAGKPGSVAWIGSDVIEVATGNGFYRIKEIQLEGKKRMKIRDFLSGHPVTPGTAFF